MASDPRKPQPTTTLLSLSPPAPTHPPTAMTPAELWTAVSALAAKKQRLRESFDRLAASSPVPIPFRWEDLDAHLSAVHSAVAARFPHPVSAPLHLDFAAGGPTAAIEHPVEHLADEERGARQEAPESNAGEGEQVDHESFGQEHAGDKGAVGGASDESEEGAIEASPEQDGEEEVSEGEIEPMEASPHHQGDEDESEEEEGEAKWPPNPAVTEKVLAQSIAAACASMDAAALVDTLCQNCRSSLPARRAFLPALLGAADPHALVVRAVGGFLARSESMTYRSWGNCVALLECVPRLTGTVIRPSEDTLAQAERLAWGWKEMMVGKSGNCRGMSRLAGWGLFTFLASYNIVLEFDADEIIRLFDNLPPQLKENCIELCKQLGLIEKMTDSIHHLIGNGQPFDAMRLASALNLTDKCPPLSILEDYVKNAKQTAEEILSKDSGSAEYLNQSMEKNVNALILSRTAVDGCNFDSVHRSSIKDEISQLLRKYEDKQQSLAGEPAFVSTSHHQQSLEQQCQLQLEMAQERGHQQRKEREFQQKRGKKCQRQQHNARNSQQKQLQNQQQQGWRWQNSTGRKPNKNQKRNQRRHKWQNPQEEQQQQQFNKRPRFNSYSYSGIRGVPFAERVRLTQNQSST